MCERGRKEAGLFCTFNTNRITSRGKLFSVDNLGGKLQLRRLLHASSHHREGAPVSEWEEELIRMALNWIDLQEKGLLFAQDKSIVRQLYGSSFSLFS